MSATTTTLPPLRQSTFEVMSCPHSYGLVFIEGLKPPDTPNSVRGTEVHSILAKYVEHCAKKRIPADFAYLDSIKGSCGDEASEILETCKESFVVDWQNFYDAEVTFYMTNDFTPAPTVPADFTAYSGILDTIYMMPGEKVARIVDYKSHPRPFAPDTFQAKLYSLMLFMHVPTLEEIEFVLRFVRYPNIAKPIKYFREDVPTLKADVQRARDRQIDLHVRYEAEGLEGLQAIPGSHCCYCPAIQNESCPIRQMNPMLEMTPQDRLSFRLWLDQANRANNAAMKAYVDGTGQEIHSQDGNGKFYTFGPAMKERTTFPLFFWGDDGLQLSPLVDRIIDWCSSVMPEDGQPTKRSPIPWPAKLLIGATQLKSYLKANKRADLHQFAQDSAAITEEAIELSVTRDAEVDDGSGEEHRNYSNVQE